MQYIFFNLNEFNKINFNEVTQTIDTMVLSIDLNKTYVSWVGNTPSFVSTLVTGQGPYDEAGFLVFINSDEWIIQ